MDTKGVGEWVVWNGGIGRGKGPSSWRGVRLFMGGGGLRLEVLDRF